MLNETHDNTFNFCPAALIRNSQMTDAQIVIEDPGPRRRIYSPAELRRCGVTRQLRDEHTYPYVLLVVCPLQHAGLVRR